MGIKQFVQGKGNAVIDVVGEVSSLVEDRLEEEEIEEPDEVQAFQESQVSVPSEESQQIPSQESQPIPPQSTVPVPNRKRLFPSPRKHPSPKKQLQRSKADESIRQTVSMAAEALSTMKNIFVKKQEKRNEYEVFGEQIALKIQKLSSERVRNIVQFKINSILFDAEMGRYEYTHAFPPPSSVSYTPFSTNTQYQMHPTHANSPHNPNPTSPLQIQNHFNPETSNYSAASSLSPDVNPSSYPNTSTTSPASHNSINSPNFDSVNSPNFDSVNSPNSVYSTL